MHISVLAASQDACEARELTELQALYKSQEGEIDDLRDRERERERERENERGALQISITIQQRSKLVSGFDLEIQKSEYLV